MMIGGPICSIYTCLIGMYVFNLCIQNFVLCIDDGNGMEPEAMRRCMSFGFSDKKSKSAIGQCINFSIHSGIWFTSPLALIT